MTYLGGDEIIVPDSAEVSAPTAELRIQRKNTLAYIKASPSLVTMSRATRVPDGAGGHRTTRVDVPEQTMRVIQSNESDQVERRNADGENVRPTLNLLSRWDADVQVGDQFKWNGHTCEVVYTTDLQYELTSEVSVR